MQVARLTLAYFPAVFFHICNFDICHEIQIATDKYKYQRMKIRVSWVVQVARLTLVSNYLYCDLKIALLWFGLVLMSNCASGQAHLGMLIFKLVWFGLDDLGMYPLILWSSNCFGLVLSLTTTSVHWRHESLWFGDLEKEVQHLVYKDLRDEIQMVKRHIYHCLGLFIAPKCVKSQNQLPFHTIKYIFTMTLLFAKIFITGIESSPCSMSGN